MSFAAQRPLVVVRNHESLPSDEIFFSQIDLNAYLLIFNSSLLKADFAKGYNFRL